MKNLNYIAKDLFNKIRGRFPSVTIGNESGEVTNVPEEARYFDFEYKEQDQALGKVSISIDEDKLSVMYSDNFVANEDQITRDNWYNFLKELRQFSKKRMLNFDTRNITKSNLDKRDYEYLATNRNTGDDNMNESKMYGNNKTSFQKIGNAKLSIKHTEAINTESAIARSQKIGKIFIESPEGEKFKYPYKHLSGARAMARHVAEGGTPYDDFGKHIVGLSEELSKLKKFNSYLNRSSVMAESLSGYSDVVKERVAVIKKSIQNLQKESFYKETLENYVAEEAVEVPDEVAENWIDELTIKQFNEELADVFPFVYKLVSEATRAVEITASDLLGEARDTHCSDKCCGSDVKAEDCTCPPTCKHCNCNAVNENPDTDRAVRMALGMDDNSSSGAPVDDIEVGLPAETYRVRPGDTLYSIYMKFKYANFQNHDRDTAIQAIMDENPDITDPAQIRPGMIIQMPYFMGSGPSGSTRGVPPGGFQKYESEIEELMGQFGESESCSDCGKSPCCCDEETDEGNAYSGAVAKAKMNGKKKGDEIDGPDGEKITLEKEGKTPLGEFILSYFDYTTGKFPKGETAVLTMVEKDYGEHFIEPAKQFLEKINSRVSEVMGYRDPELMDDDNLGNVITTGVKGSYDFIAKSIKDFEELIRNNPNHPKVPQIEAELAKLRPQLAQARKDSGMGETEDLRRLAGL